MAAAARVAGQALMRITEWHVTVMLLSAVVSCVRGCNTSEAVPPEHAYVLYSVDDLYVIYRCKTGYRFEKIYQDGIQWCDMMNTEQWIGEPGTCQSDPCFPNPCQNNGHCSSSEDPWGMGYYCYCPSQNGTRIGGRHCQIVDPCNVRPCPPATYLCYTTFTNDKGRYCFDRRWMVIAEPEDIM